MGRKRRIKIARREARQAEARRSTVMCGYQAPGSGKACDKPGTWTVTLAPLASTRRAGVRGAPASEPAGEGRTVLACEEHKDLLRRRGLGVAYEPLNGTTSGEEATSFQSAVEGVENQHAP